MRVCQFRHFRGRVEAPMYAAGRVVSSSSGNFCSLRARYAGFFGVQGLTRFV
jgi:hypothetical protein